MKIIVKIMQCVFRLIKEGKRRFCPCGQKSKSHQPSLANWMKKKANVKRAAGKSPAAAEDLKKMFFNEFEQLVGQSNARIYFKDTKRRFVFANPATVEAVKGMANGQWKCAEDIEGLRDENIFSGSHLKKARIEDGLIIRGMHPVTKAGLKNGEWFECYELETWKFGMLVLVHTRKRPWLDHLGKVIGLIGVTRPVEIGSAEREFNKQIAPNLGDSHVVRGTYLERLSPYLKWLKQKESKGAASAGDIASEPHDIWFDEGFDRAFPLSNHRRKGESTRTRRRRGLGKDRFANVVAADKRKVMKFLKAARKLKVNTQSVIVFRAHVQGGDPKAADGPVVWIHATASVFSRAGEPYLYVTHRNCRLEEVQEFFSRRILEKFPGNVFVKNAKHEFRYVNQKLSDDLGECDPRAVIGKTDADFHFPPEEIEKFQLGDSTVINGRAGQCHISPAEPFSPHGKNSADLVTIKFAISEADLEPWMDGNQKLVLGLSWKIDDEWLAYHDGRAIWHTLIEYSSDAIYYKEPLGRYLHCNGVFARLYSKTRDEILRMDTRQLLGNSPDLLQRVLTEEQDMLEKGLPIEDQEHIFHRPGDKRGQRWFSTKLPVTGSDKKTVTRILGLLRNKEADDLETLTRLTLSPRAMKARKAKKSAEFHAQAVIIFCDLRGFSKLASDLASAPVALVDLLQRYMDLVARSAEKYCFELDKFMGDGAMLFRLPDWDLDEENERKNIRDISCDAVEFAFELFRELPSIVKEWKDANEFAILKECSIKMGIGIHMGPATVGLITGGGRLQFTSLGQTVNDCSRFEMLAGKDGLPSLLVSPQLAGLIHDKYDVKRHEAIKNSKMAEAFTAYSLKARLERKDPPQSPP